MHHVGTVPMFKMHDVGTVPTFKMHHVGTIKNQNQLWLIIDFRCTLPNLKEIKQPKKIVV